MAGVVRWFKFGGVTLKKFTSLKSLDEREGEDNHEMATAPRSPQRDLDGDNIPDVYTVEEAVDKLGFGAFQVLISLFAGVIWLTEAFEVMILSILSATLKCEWNLSYVQEASITMVVFFGFLVGGPIWGIAADKFGRKKTLFVIMCGGFTFGIISSFSPEYYSLLLFRGLLGFSFGGGFLGITYCLEFLPARTRAVIVCLLVMTWAIGSVLEALLALVVMTSIDHEPWRWLLGFSALPMLPIILVIPFVPESPRYLTFYGKEEKAKKVLALMSILNCKQPLSGRLVTQEEKEQLLQERNKVSSAENKIVETSMTEPEDQTGEPEMELKDYGTLPTKEENDQISTIDNDLVVMSSDNESDQELLIASDECTHRRTSFLKRIIKEKAISYYHWFLLLFKNGWWRTTLLLWYLWLSANIVYYGGILLTTSLFQHDEHCGLTDGNNSNETCRPLSKSDYIHLVWTTCAEFPGRIWIILLLLVIGRKKSMALTTTTAAVCYGLLFFCLGKTLLIVFLFGVRGFATGFFQGIYLYTPEVYPTSIRGFGMSLCSSFSRIGAMLAPYIAQTLLAYTTIGTISLFVVFSVLASVAALLLPIETRGRAMKDSGG